MENKQIKEERLQLIKNNVETYGYHLNIVLGGPEPRYAYTIGLHGRCGFELVFAGGLYYQKNELLVIFEHVIAKVGTLSTTTGVQLVIDELGSFTIGGVDDSWSSRMLLGVYDYYNISTVKAYQILIDTMHMTFDFPNLSIQYDFILEPAWRWLVKEWEYPFSEKATAIVDLRVLQGEVVTEIVHTDVDEWEIYSNTGFDAEKVDIRIVPIGLLLEMDKTIISGLTIDIGKGLWRDSKKDSWNDWG